MFKSSVILIIFSCIFTSVSGLAQERDYFSFEAAGSGGFGSLNYERPILAKTNMPLHLRVGFSFTPIDPSNGVNMIFPVMLHWLIGKKAHKIDLAIGQALSITTKLRLFLSAPLAAGYRYQPLNKNYFLRVSYTPLLSYLVGFQWQNWAGVTYGYHFNRRK